jgi:hypothetical protein
MPQSQFYLLLRGGVVIGHVFPGKDGQLEVTVEASTFFVEGNAADIKEGTLCLVFQLRPEKYFGGDEEEER